MKHPTAHQNHARVQIWGVLNVTEDSFSDGGSFLSSDDALRHALKMVEEGADVIDVGGESTRPRGATYGDGFNAVSAREEIQRVRPVITELCKAGIRVSIDTTKGEVARAAVDAGASFINDVSGGRDPLLLKTAADSSSELILMHNRDDGAVNESNTQYEDLVGDVLSELDRCVLRAIEHGVPLDNIWIDPGIGFAKTAEQSLMLLANTDRFVSTGRRVLVGPSRKSFIAHAVTQFAGTNAPEPAERLAGTAASITAAILGSAHAVRVHDVSEMVQATAVAQALRDFQARQGPHHV